MSEYGSGLPVRSESDGSDEKLVAKLVDGSVGGSNQMRIDSDKNAHVEDHGNDPAGLDVVLLLTEEGRTTDRGDYNVTTNTKPSSTAQILHARVTAPTEVNQTFRPTGVASSDGTFAKCADVAIRDEAGNPFTTSNPLPVTMVDSEGTEVNAYTATTALAAGASANIDYTVTAAKTLKLQQIEASGSGKILVEVKLETAAASGIFTTYWKKRNSTANPNIELWIKELISQVALAKVRVTITNKDNQAQDIDVTISGHEI